MLRFQRLFPALHALWLVTSIAASAFAQSSPPVAPPSPGASSGESDAPSDGAATVEAPAAPNTEDGTPRSAQVAPAPVVVPAVAPPASTDDYFFPETSAPRWKFSDSRLIIGAENLSGIEHYERTSYDADDRKIGEASGTDINFLYPGSGAVRLSADYAQGGTIGGSFGYRSSPVTYSGPNEPRTSASDHSYEIGLRAGALLRANSHAFCIWLRGGYEYRVYTSRASEQSQRLDTSYHLFGVDPRFIFALGPHVGVAFGPYFTLAMGTSEVEDFKIASHRVLVGGLSFSLYTFLVG